MQPAGTHRKPRWMTWCLNLPTSPDFDGDTGHGRTWRNTTGGLTSRSLSATRCGPTVWHLHRDGGL